MNIFVDWDRGKRWSQEILPRMRKVYSGMGAPPKGEITWRKYNLEPEGDISFWNFSGYDYVWADVFDSDYHFNGLDGHCKSYDDCRIYVRILIGILGRLKERGGVEETLLGSEAGATRTIFSRGGGERGR